MDEEMIILEEEIESIEEIEITENERIIASDISIKHGTLQDIYEKDQHLITSITGLKEKLDEIESLKTVESNMRQQADYYKWEDENLNGEDRVGLFVSLHTYIPNEETGVRCGTGNIQICDGTTDVFGVTVERAGFVGNQEYIKLDGGDKIGRDGKYNLVVHSGVVAVQCESGVSVGDYVVPHAFGKAKKSDWGNGYLVTGLSEFYNKSYAIISLASPSTIAEGISYNLYDEKYGLVGRMAEVEKDIGNLTSFTNNTYELAETIKSMQDTQSSIQESTNSMQEVVGSLSNKVDGFGGRLDEVEEDAIIATQQSTQALMDAANIRTEAVQKVNEAILNVEAIQKDIQALDYQVAPYSVGEYSQAYGLTWEQAKDTLTVGQVHIPTIDPYYEEFYNGYEEIEQEGGTHSNKQKFYKTFYYTWDGTKWTPSSSNAVTFAPFDATNTTIQYWYVTADTTDYKKGDIVYWNNGDPKVVANISENGFSRAVNYLRKDAYETSIEITNARGNCASLSEKLDSDGAKVAMVASVVTEMKDVKPVVPFYDTLDALNESVTNPDANAYYCVGNSAPYEVYRYNASNKEYAKQTLIYYDGVDFCKINTASIISAVNNDGDSSISLNADKINFSGLSTFFSTDENGGITAINGGGILTNSITASQIDATDLHVQAAHIDGKVTASQIDVKDLSAEKIEIFDNEGKIIFKADKNAENLNDRVLISSAYIDGELIADKVKTDRLSAITANLGDVTAGTMWSSNYSKAVVWTTSWQTSEGLEYTLNNDGTEYIVTGIGTCKDWDLIIPAVYNGLPVTSIDSSAFYGCDNLISVVIGGNITSIGDLAFYGCTNLISIKIPNSVISIGNLSFYSCYKLIEICNLSSLKINAGESDNGYIGLYAKNIYINTEGGSKLSRDDCGFIFYNDGNNYYLMGKENISYVTNLILPCGYNNQDYIIHQNAFSNYSNLISVKIPDNITIIGDVAFSNCASLTDIIISNNVISIGDSAFGWCNSLKNVYYLGSSEEWDAINIGNNNPHLINAKKYYYSENQPIQDGNYWHYGQAGFKLSCDDYYMIDSKYFKVSPDGKINAILGNIGGISVGTPGFGSMGIISGLYCGNFALGVNNDGNGQIMFTSSKASPDMSPYNTFINNEEVRGLHGVFYDLKIHSPIITTGSGYTYDLSNMLSRIENLEANLTSATSTTTE